jgi:hypothetical protein
MTGKRKKWKKGDGDVVGVLGLEIALLEDVVVSVMGKDVDKRGKTRLFERVTNSTFVLFPVSDAAAGFLSPLGLERGRVAGVSRAVLGLELEEVERVPGDVVDVVRAGSELERARLGGSGGTWQSPEGSLEWNRNRKKRKTRLLDCSL